MSTTNLPYYFDFTHSVVRQLAWTITSPLLLSGDNQQIWPTQSWCKRHSNAVVDWLTALDRDPVSLRDFLADEKDHRLGARFERLIEFWLDNSPVLICQHRRLQFIDQGHTHGEFDFIVHDVLNQHSEHWEVAAKFYLGVPTTTGPHSLSWIGPGKRDRLLNKFNHIVQRQLTLGDAHPPQEFLQSLGIHLTRVRAFVKGRLFYPLNTLNQQPQNHTLAPMINPAHERGIWCGLSEVNSLQIESCLALSKTSWLDPHPNHGVDGRQIKVDEIAAYVDVRPTCFDVIRRNKTQIRLFVVADGWYDPLTT